MVDHDILLSRLQERFIVTGKLLLWFQSYLFSRTQYVSVDDGASLKHALLPRFSFGTHFVPSSHFSAFRHNFVNT